jgi:hypothetical protein
MNNRDKICGQVQNLTIAADPQFLELKELGFSNEADLLVVIARPGKSGKGLGWASQQRYLPRWNLVPKF